MNKVNIWQILPYLLPVISYLIGLAKNKLKLPKKVQTYLKDTEVMQVIFTGIREAGRLAGATNAEKQEYVRAFARTELKKLLGETVPDSILNLLIEVAFSRIKW